MGGRVPMSRPAAAAGSLAWFVLAPGLVAGVVPWLLTGWDANDMPDALQALGVVLIVAGAAVMIRAFARFVVEGLGTPAPAAPPERLVVGGLYRYVRNPMYVALLATITGQALLLGRASLVVYAAVVWAVTFAFVRGYEEPALRRRFGTEYDSYRRAVPGWLPRPRPWDPR